MRIRLVVTETVRRPSGANMLGRGAAQARYGAGRYNMDAPAATRRSA